MTTPRPHTFGSRHFRGRFRGRAGAALLVVLATLVMVVTASATLAGLAATTKLQRKFDERAIKCDEMLHAAEEIVQHWLKTESATVVLGPDVDVPALDIVHDVINSGEADPIRVRITAVDQCGMAPIDVARSGSPLRLALSPEALDRIDAVGIE